MLKFRFAFPAGFGVDVVSRSYRKARRIANRAYQLERYSLGWRRGRIRLDRVERAVYMVPADYLETSLCFSYGPVEAFWS